MRITTGECQQTFIIVPVERETEWKGEGNWGLGNGYDKAGGVSGRKKKHAKCTEIQINKLKRQSI